jgi:hypothetical protein
MKEIAMNEKTFPVTTDREAPTSRPRTGIGGPQTPEGKEVVSKNALKHGLCAQAVVIQAGDGQESQEEFDNLLAGLWADLQPQGRLEEMQVERIAVCYWRLRRCLQAELGEIRKTLDSCELCRDQARLDALRLAKMIPQSPDSQKPLWQDSWGLDYIIRLWEAARKELADKGNFPAQVNNLFPRTLQGWEKVPWENHEAALQWIDREIGKLQALKGLYEEKETLELQALQESLALPSKEVVDKILRYETTISRQLYKAMSELERLQRLRKGEPVPPPINVQVSSEE